MQAESATLMYRLNYIEMRQLHEIPKIFICFYSGLYLS